MQIEENFKEWFVAKTKMEDYIKAKCFHHLLFIRYNQFYQKLGFTYLYLRIRWLVCKFKSFYELRNVLLLELTRISFKLARYLVCHKTCSNNLDTYLEIEWQFFGKSPWHLTRNPPVFDQWSEQTQELVRP